METFLIVSSGILFVSCACFFHVSNGFLNIEELQEMRYSLDIFDTPISFAEVDLTEGVQLSSVHGQNYFCQLPSKALEMEQKNSNEVKLASDYPVVKLLEPLKHKPCLKIVKGWWTYEFCFMKSLHQYHVEDGEPVGEIINLGNHESEFDWNDEQKIKAKMFKKKRIQKYHTQYYVNGTECSVIKHKRDSEVRYYCDESASVPYIERIDEPSTCSYIITIRTNLLCAHPHTRITYKSKPIEVLCRPLLSPDSYQSYVEKQAKAELAAYEEANMLLKQKRNRLRKLLLTLKEEAPIDPISQLDKSVGAATESSHGMDKPKNEDNRGSKELAIDFIQRFAPEDKFDKLGSSGQAKLLDAVVELISQFRALPSADMARLIRFEILSFIERRSAFTSDYFLNLFRGISSSTEDVDQGIGWMLLPILRANRIGSPLELGILLYQTAVRQTSHGMVRIKVRAINELDDDVPNQDPEIVELEKEIENELAEAGVISKKDIEVHVITSRKGDNQVTELDARHFKEALIEIMGGTTIAERERERFNRLVDNYNLIYKNSDINNESEEEKQPKT